LIQTAPAIEIKSATSTARRMSLNNLIGIPPRLRPQTTAWHASITDDMGYLGLKIPLPGILGKFRGSASGPPDATGLIHQTDNAWSFVDNVIKVSRTNR
jgi:hypothetical protein